MSSQLNVALICKLRPSLMYMAYNGQMSFTFKHSLIKCSVVCSIILKGERYVLAILLIFLYSKENLIKISNLRE